MKHRPIHLLILTALLASTPLFAQDKEPAPQKPPRPSGTKLPAAYAEIEGLIDSIRRTSPEARSRHLDRLYTSCGTFLDRHLDAASADQLTLVGTTWLQLASRSADTKALGLRLQKLSAHAGLPPRLDQLVRLHTARLKIKVGATAPAWSGVDLRDGKTLNGKDLKGKLVLLEFASSQDPNSRGFWERKLAPLLAPFKANSEFTLVSVLVDVNGGAAANRDIPDAPWRLVSDPKRRCATSFGVAAAPFLVLLDAKRKVLALGPGWRVVGEVRRVLNERLAETPKKKKKKKKKND